MIVRADTRRIPLRDGCVQCVVTSPPYWGLRDYGTGTWVAGDPSCNHVPRSNLGATNNKGSPAGNVWCQACRCGARRVDLQIGLEPTPDEYVSTLVEVFREIWRVLRDDGTVWLNLGDSYAGSGKGRNGDGTHQEGGKQGTSRGTIEGRLTKFNFGKPKDLCGIPWRVAFALQANGWYLRSDIIWAKPNPMPESVTDRPTRSHEYIFLLSKRADYYYDQDAIREPETESSLERYRYSAISKIGKTSLGTYRLSENNKGNMTAAGVPRTTAGLKSHEHQPHPNGRNKRDVWTVNSEPFPDAHFATFPKSLIRPCILAGSRVGDWVLDPFLGSGTTIEVCTEEGRRGVGLELNRAYIEIARQRTAQMGFIFCDCTGD